MPLAGTFVLVSLPAPQAGESFAIEDIDFRDPEGSYTVSGKGTYARDPAADPTDSMALDVTVNGVSGIPLVSVPLYESAWPTITIRLEEKVPRDPLHRYAIHIEAAPRADEEVRYELEEGSSLIDECRPCGRSPVEVPITGSFVLGRIGGGGPDPTTTYRVDGIDFKGASETLEYNIMGTGLYRHGGEVAVLQSLVLDIANNGAFGFHLLSGQVPVEAEFPRVDILASQEDDRTMVVYTLRIIASPAEEPSEPFRRGDANDDGVVDISDAVHVLSWLFSGGEAPGCAGAADTNGDLAHDLSDGVSLLNHLFQGAPAPPPPGPDACGAGPAGGPGCVSFANCP